MVQVSWFIKWLVYSTTPQTRKVIQPKDFLLKIGLHKRLSEKEKNKIRYFYRRLWNQLLWEQGVLLQLLQLQQQLLHQLLLENVFLKNLQSIISSYFVKKQKGILFCSVICVSWNEIKKKSGPRAPIIIKLFSIVSKL